MIDNTVAEGLAADTVNAKRSKSMDVRFFWFRDRIQQAQFAVRHLAGRWNISDFFHQITTEREIRAILSLCGDEPRHGTTNAIAKNNNYNIG